MKKILLVLVLMVSLTPINSFAYSLNKTTPLRESTEKTSNDFILRVNVIIEIIKRRIEDNLATGNVNIDYLGQMIELHSEEVQTSLAIQGFTDNPVIINLANDIIADEVGELKEMRLLRKELYDNYKLGSQNDDKYTSEYKKIGDSMVNSFATYKPTGNNEIDYLNYILIGNDGSIKISKAALNYLNDETSREIAENIIKLKTEQNTKIYTIIKEISDSLKNLPQ